MSWAVSLLRRLDPSAGRMCFSTWILYVSNVERALPIRSRLANHLSKRLPRVAVVPTTDAASDFRTFFSNFSSALPAARFPPMNTLERCTGGPCFTTLPLSSRTVRLGSRPT